MNPAKAITRVPVPDLRCLRAETPAAPMNIALIGISGGATLTGPGGLAQLAAVCSLIAARLERAPVLRRVLLLTRPGLGRLAWIDAQHLDIDDHVVTSPHPGGRSPARRISWAGAHAGR